MKKIYQNLLNSLNGLKIGLKEHSFILELIGGLFLLTYLLITNFNYQFKLIIILVYFVLLAFELLNTAIEKLSDKITNKFDLEIKKIKDLSSASVFIVLVFLLVLIITSLFLNN